MDLYFIVSALIAVGLGFFLFYKKWRILHIISILLGFIFVFEFSQYGSRILAPIFPKIHAAGFWVVAFVVIYGGGALISSIPLAVHDFKKERHKIINIFKVFLALGLIYTAIDNFTMGPFAAGPSSPYGGKNLCTLDATYYSEDVFFGCVIEKTGIDPFSEMGAFLTYNVCTSLLILLAGAVIGYKKLENLVFEEELESER